MYLCHGNFVKGESMSKRSMQKKVALLQQKWDGENLEDQNNPDTGDWSPENIAKNRAAAVKEQNPTLGLLRWAQDIVKTCHCERIPCTGRIFTRLWVAGKKHS